MKLKTWFCDLHVHIGQTEDGRPVKISASRDLTFRNIAEEAACRKGIDMIGIIDCHSPPVQREIERCLARGEMEEIPGGGIRYGTTTILLGSEIEVRDSGMGPAHLLAYFATLDAIKDFTAWLSGHMRNVELSSQRIYVPARALQREVLERGGLLVPAHIFTPHRSVYGSCTERMADLLDISKVQAVELGLSADSEMAGWLSELAPMTFLTNSDAHSLAKIGREYNEIAAAAPSFDELKRTVARQDGRRIVANYGLQPRLGKYHRTFCGTCGRVAEEEAISVDRCRHCGSGKIVRGVMDRIRHIADRDEPLIPDHRPPYRYQVPLEFIPGLGRRKLQQLLDAFGTEMHILHRAAERELAEVAGEAIAGLIVRAREGKLEVASGGGGIYGKVKSSF